MPKLEQTKRDPETVAQAPMDSGDSKPPEDKGVQGELPKGESKESLRETSVVREHAEQQTRNSELMKSLSDLAYMIDTGITGAGDTFREVSSVVMPEPPAGTAAIMSWYTGSLNPHRDFSADQQFWRNA